MKGSHVQAVYSENIIKTGRLSHILRILTLISKRQLKRAETLQNDNAEMFAGTDETGFKVYAESLLKLSEYAEYCTDNVMFNGI